MSDITYHNPQQFADNFAKSASWRLFTLKFAENFYGLKQEHADYPAWFNLAMEASSNMQLLLQALDEVEEVVSTTKARLTVKKTRRAYNKIRSEFYAKELKTTDCELCNNTRVVHNVETMSNGNMIILDPAHPMPCKAHPSVSRCTCRGGKKEDVDKRFIAPVENGETLIGCEHITQRIFIANCDSLLKGGK